MFIWSCGEQIDILKIPNYTNVLIILCTGVCTTEYHTIFYHSYFMSQVYIMDYY